MYIKLDIPTEFEVKSLTDLPNFKNLMENLKMKVNKSQLARELNVDRRTIDKYMNGFTPKGKENIKIDVHYEVIVIFYRIILNKPFIICGYYGSI